MLTSNVVAQFWSRVEKAAAGECWRWTGRVNKDGYGTFYVASRGPLLVHRLALEIAVGPIPSGMLVLHDCDNPPCCNPGHIRFGTHAENMRDGVRRNRFCSGVSHGNSKVSDSQKEDILRRIIRGEKQASVAERYSISQAHVSRIALRNGIRRRTGPKVTFGGHSGEEKGQA